MRDRETTKVRTRFVTPSFGKLELRMGLSDALASIISATFFSHLLSWTSYMPARLPASS